MRELEQGKNDKLFGQLLMRAILSRRNERMQLQWEVDYINVSKEDHFKCSDRNSAIDHLHWELLNE
jgi:hypothetical protein